VFTDVPIADFLIIIIVISKASYSDISDMSGPPELDPGSSSFSEFQTHFLSAECNI
jgi:hypothetical protein